MYEAPTSLYPTDIQLYLHHIFFIFFNFLFCTELWLINNVVIVSSEHPRDSAIHTHVSIPPPNPLLSRLPHSTELYLHHLVLPAKLHWCLWLCTRGSVIYSLFCSILLCVSLHTPPYFLLLTVYQDYKSGSKSLLTLFFLARSTAIQCKSKIPVVWVSTKSSLWHWMGLCCNNKWTWGKWAA